MVDRSWIIGSLPDCDLQVDSPTVSGRHCRLIKRGDSYLLDDLNSSNGTYVSGERITTPRIVRRSDSVTLGRTVPMPWPDSTDFITIGRLPGNDVTVPLDTVSNPHARIERDGTQFTLVDLGSTNGTAINDPLNKITRATISSGDFVFLGTHRMAAADLMARLPMPAPRPATMLERDSPQALITKEEPVEPAATETVAKEHPSEIGNEWTNPRSWIWGIALSIACLIVFLGFSKFPNSPSPIPPPPSEPIHDTREASITPHPVPPTPPEQRTVDEDYIRAFEPAVVLLGIRIGDKVVLSEDAGWAIRPDTIICPTAILKELESIRSKDAAQDEQIVACTSTNTFSILHHESAHGYSIAKLETPLKVGPLATLGSATPSVGQSLAALTLSAEHHERQKMQHEIVHLVVDHIQRADDHSPIVYHCKPIEPVKGIVGSPVFDSTSKVIGTIQAVINQDVQVVPVN